MLIYAPWIQAKAYYKLSACLVGMIILGFIVYSNLYNRPFFTALTSALNAPLMQLMFAYIIVFARKNGWLAVSRQDKKMNDSDFSIAPFVVVTLSILYILKKEIYQLNKSNLKKQVSTVLYITIIFVILASLLMVLIYRKKLGI